MTITQKQPMTAQQIINAVESESADVFSWTYTSQREYLDELIAYQLENGNPVEFAQGYLSQVVADVRRAMLHALQHVDAPAEVIEKVFA